MLGGEHGELISWHPDYKTIPQQGPQELEALLKIKERKLAILNGIPLEHTEPSRDISDLTEQIYAIKKAMPERKVGGEELQEAKAEAKTVGEADAAPRRDGKP